MQVGLNLLLEDVNVVLKFAREKFADLLVDAVHIRGQRQQSPAAGSARVRCPSSCRSPPCWHVIAAFLARRNLAYSRLRSFDQSRLQFQLPPQPAFFASHLAIIALVIEARQMQDSMQRQNFHLVGNRVAQARGVFPGDVRGNCHISGNAPGLISFHLRRWKRQYIRGLVGSSESPVKSTHFRTVRHQYIHRAPQLDRAPRPQHKAFERCCAQTHDSSSEDDHPFPQRASTAYKTNRRAGFQPSCAA